MQLEKCNKLNNNKTNKIPQQPKLAANNASLLKLAANNASLLNNEIAKKQHFGFSGVKNCLIPIFGHAAKKYANNAVVQIDA